VCLENLSLEGTPRNSPFTLFDGVPWDPCPNGVNRGGLASEVTSTPTWPYPAPSQGNSYGEIGTNSGFGGFGSLAQTLCQPIAAGKAVSFKIDVARVPRRPPPGGDVDAKMTQIQIFGGTARCGETELLWTSPDLMPTWSNVCVTLRPSAETTTLSFRPLGDNNPLFNGFMAALMDNIVPVASCP
jgi:hypothetical protein